MTSLEDKIREIEEEISTTEYNKATQHHIGKLKAKLAKLKEDFLKRSSKGGSGFGFAVKKTGHATVVIIGFPSVGKSTLLNKLTNAQSAVGSYDFTTLDVIPGLMEYKNVRLQLLDVPGIIGGASSGKGRGREVLAVARNADVVLILADTTKKGQFRQIVEELEGAGVRLNKHPPRVSIRRTLGGGVHLLPTVPLTKIDVETARSIANTFGVHNAEISVHEDITMDELVDAFNGNRVYTPAVFALNKVDTVDKAKVKEFTEDVKECILISAEKDVNLDKLREEIFAKLGFIRVFLKPQGGRVDAHEPLILKTGSTVRDICGKLHKDFLHGFRYAVIWGASAKHKGQRIGLTHTLSDGDVVSIIKK